MIFGLTSNKLERNLWFVKFVIIISSSNIFHKGTSTRSDLKNVKRLENLQKIIKKFEPKKTKSY